MGQTQNRTNTIRLVRLVHVLEITDPPLQPDKEPTKLLPQGHHLIIVRMWDHHKHARHISFVSPENFLSFFEIQ